MPGTPKMMDLSRDPHLKKVCARDPQKKRFVLIHSRYIYFLMFNNSNSYEIVSYLHTFLEITECYMVYKTRDKKSCVLSAF